jgi:predicted Zn-ribbon and HTH transcriptional regulator
MSKDNIAELQEQLLRGVHRMCVSKDDCNDCPFYITKCVFEDPKPRTWSIEESVEIKPAPEHLPVPPKEQVKEVAEETAEEPAAEEPVAPQPPVKDDTDGTWLMSTTMGSAFTKYVFICSKCGYKKESYFSIAPTSYCPECEKRKHEQS